MKFTILRIYKLDGDHYCGTHKMPVLSFYAPSWQSARRHAENALGLHSSGWYAMNQWRHTAGYDIVEADEVPMALIGHQARQLQVVTL